MELEPVGRVDDPETLDLEPIVIPIVGYTTARKEVIEPFRFRPVIPWEQSLDVFDAQQDDGRIKSATVRKFLHSCLIAEDREKWEEFTLREDVYVGPETWVAAFTALFEVYNARPTMPRSASTAGGGQTKQTSPAASRAKASASKKKRARSHST